MKDVQQSLVLQTQNLETGYTIGSEVKTISKSLNLDLHLGDVVAIMGPNGSGKSTLIRTLCKLQETLSGSVLVSGKEIGKHNSEDLSKMVSVVLTDRIANENIIVREVVALGRHPYTNWLGKLSQQDQQVVLKAISDVGLVGFEDRLLSSLSDGEKQRVMIARALAQESPIIILDEPTAHLDITHRFEVMRLLRELAATSKKAILLSIHELDLALQSADYLWLLDGSDVLVGRPEEMIINGMLQDVLGSKNLQFDALSGTFQMHHKPKMKVQIDGGNELLIAWTERVLLKNSFERVADCDVKIVIEDNPNTWVYRNENYLSLDTLLLEMKKRCLNLGDDKA